MTGRLTTEQLKVIRNRAEEATDGPWEISNITDIFTELGAMNNEGVTADRNDGWQIAECGTGVTFVDGELTELTFDENQANTQFIAHAREDIPALLAEVERLREALEEIADIDDWDYGLEHAKDITFKTIGEPVGWDGIDEMLGEYYEDIAKETEELANDSE